MQAFHHPITVCLAGPESGDLAARLGSCLTPHRLLACAKLEDAEALAAQTGKATAFEVLPAQLDDEIRNYAPGDLYVKFRPQDPSAFLTKARHVCPIAVVVVLAASQSPEALRVCLTSLSAHARQCLLVIPDNRWREGIDLVNDRLAGALHLTAGAIDDETLAARIRDLVARHFDEAGRACRDALMLNGAAFIDQPAASAALDEAKRSFSAVAHCVSADPPGVLMMTDRGEQAFLLICDDAYDASQEELSGALEMDAPAPSGFAEASAIRSWRDIVAAGTPLVAAPRLRTVLVPQTYERAAVFDQIIARRSV